MSKTRIKICGLTRIQDIQYVNEALPDYIGFVFAKSRRQISPEYATELRRALDKRINAVGVFVNENPDLIIDICKKKVIDVIQLHGDEDEQYISYLRQKTYNPVIKAVRVKDGEAPDIFDRLLCDYLLFDTYSPEGYGGTGKSFDWSLINKVNKPFFLAGGLNSENVKDAISTAKPYCVDISSCVETDGFKDIDKILKFIEEVRSVK